MDTEIHHGIKIDVRKMITNVRANFSTVGCKIDSIISFVLLFVLPEGLSERSEAAMSTKEEKKKKKARATMTMRCYYEVLNIGRRATDEEIKKAFKKAALLHHPDRNLDRVEEANEMFKEIQRAYSVLSDPDSRAWYDNHRLSILRGETDSEDVAAAGGSEERDEVINLWPFFSPSCFSGMGDGPGEFYTVYSELFKRIDELENEESDEESEEEEEEEEEVEDGDVHSEEEKRKTKDRKGTKKHDRRGETAAAAGVDEGAPSFGNSKTPWESVSRFYSHWKNFASVRAFSSRDEFNRAEAPDRRTKRAIDKENKRLRDKARREYNDRVRHLAEFVHKIDPRARVHAAEVAKKRQEQEEREQREKIEREKKKVAAGKEKAAQRAKNLAEEIEKLTLEHRGTGEYNPFTDTGSEEIVEEEEEDKDQAFCLACGKQFKSRQQLLNHESSKNHRERVRKLFDEVSLPGESREEEKEPEPEQAPASGWPKKAKKQKKQQKRFQKMQAQAVAMGSEESEDEGDRTTEQTTPSTSPEPDDEEPEQDKAAEKKARRMQRRAKKEQRQATHPIPKPASIPEERPEPPQQGGVTCNTCGMWFSSRNKCFQHIKETGHALRI